MVYEGLAPGVNLGDYPQRAFCPRAHVQISEFLDFLRQEYGGQLAGVYTDEDGKTRTVTYDGLVADVENTAAAWQEKFDPERPQKVSLRLEPGYWWLVSILAAWRLRQAVCLVSDSDKCQPDTVIQTVEHSPARPEARQRLTCFQPQGDDLAVLITTSGTTGQPKVVALTQKNVLAVIWGGQFLHDFRGDRAVFSWLPGEHILGLSVLLWWCSCGAQIFFPLDWRHPEGLLQAARPTVVVMPTLILQKLTGKLERASSEHGDQNSWRQYFGGALNQIICGGEAVPVSIQEKWALAGIEVLATYGCTECAPGIASGYRHLGVSASVGRALANIEVKFVGGSNENEGEIWVRGPQVMSGYYQDRGRTAAVLQGGWYRTGDWGRRDENGLLYVTGRM